LESSSRLEDVARILAERSDVSWFLVADADRVVGALTRSDALGALGERGRGATVGEVVRRDWLRVAPRAHLADIVSGMRAHGASCALVVDGPDLVAPATVRGLITKVEIADGIAELSELYAN
jgi:CBS domain-containing protein